MADVMIRWKNNDEPEFTNEKTQEISKELDYIFLKASGIYQTRQYEISFTDDVPFMLINMEEEVVLLGY